MLKSYKAYIQGCPHSLNAWSMFGLGNSEDIMYRAINAKKDLEAVEWPDLPATPEQADTTSSAPAENCTSVQRI